MKLNFINGNKKILWFEKNYKIWAISNIIIIKNDIITNERVFQATTSLRMQESNVVYFNYEIYSSIKMDKIHIMTLTWL